MNIDLFNGLLSGESVGAMRDFPISQEKRYEVGYRGIIS
jgi:hypothetical protein